MIEAAELLEQFQWNNPSPEEVLQDERLFTSVRHELADVVIYALEMATLLDIDVEAIAREK